MLNRISSVYRLAPEALLFKGMTAAPETFLRMPVVFVLRPSARAHLKKALFHAHPVIKPLAVFFFFLSVNYNIRVATLSNQLTSVPLSSGLVFQSLCSFISFVSYFPEPYL